MNEKSKYVSRRKFISDAAAIGALGAVGVGAVVSSCSRKYTAPGFLDQAPDGPVLKAGLIGCGSRGTGAAINFVDAGPNLEIAALGDLFDDRLKNCRVELKDKRGIEVSDQNCFIGFDAYQKVIDSGVDVVILTQPTHFRPKSFEYAIQARKHVFAEKPIAVDPVGLRTVIAAGKRAETIGMNVVVGTQRRHQRDYVKTYEMVKNGAIGDLISAKCYWNQGRMWHVNAPIQKEWSEMEYMVRNWVHWDWLCGDQALGFGARQRMDRGNIYDSFSTNFEFDDGRQLQSMTRQIDGCTNRVLEVIYGTKGFTNAQNKIIDYNGKLIWQYEYPLGSDGKPTRSVAVPPYVQEHIDLVTAIRTGKYINETQNICESNMIGIMGRESAYSGQEVTWDEMMNSDLSLGPKEYKMGPVNVSREAPLPGTGRV